MIISTSYNPHPRPTIPHTSIFACFYCRRTFAVTPARDRLCPRCNSASINCSTPAHRAWLNRNAPRLCSKCASIQVHSSRNCSDCGPDPDAHMTTITIVWPDGVPA